MNPESPWFLGIYYFRKSIFFGESFTQKMFRVKLLEEAEKWEQRDEIPNCRKNQFHPINVKQQNPSDVEIASNEFIKLPGLYDEMHDYIFSLKKLKNDKINELITKYCNLQTCLQ